MPWQPDRCGRPLTRTDKSAERVAKFGADTPMKRPAQPEEIASAFVFLAAPSCSSYITGGYSGGRALALRPGKPVAIGSNEAGKAAGP